jgi:hypothetical protein
MHTSFVFVSWSFSTSIKSMTYISILSQIQLWEKISKLLILLKNNDLCA